MKNFKKGKIFLALVIMCGALVFASCTKNTRARAWGGEMTISVPAGQKLVNVTWKENDVWILTRPMRTDESPETYSFYEKSKWGLMEGEIKLIESK